MKHFATKYILLNILPLAIFLILILLNRIFYIPTTGALLFIGLILATPIYLVVINYKQLSSKISSFLITTIFLFIIMFIFVFFVHLIGIIFGNQDTVSTGLNILAMQFELLLLSVSWIIACNIKLIQIMVSKSKGKESSP